MDKNNYSVAVLKELFEIARSISSVNDIDTLLKRINSAAEKLIDAEASSIMLLDDDKQSLVFKAASGEKGGIIQKLKIKIGQGIAGNAAMDKKTIVINDVTKDSRFNSITDKATGFTTKSIISVPMLIDNELIGVMEVINKNNNGTFANDDIPVVESLASLAAVSINNAHIAEDQRNFFINVIEVLVVAIESRDLKLEGHCWNVAQASTTIGKRLGLKDHEYKNLYYGALLHDIGLIKIKSDISLGEGTVSLTKDFSPEMNHPRIGAELVRQINLLKGAVPIILHHHENYDGTGYPDRLVGENIPIEARIVAVAEAAEEMRLGGFSEDRILQMLRNGVQTRFDPMIVEIYISEFSESKV